MMKRATPSCQEEITDINQKQFWAWNRNLTESRTNKFHIEIETIHARILHRQWHEEKDYVKMKTSCKQNSSHSSDFLKIQFWNKNFIKHCVKSFMEINIYYTSKFPWSIFFSFLLLK